MKKYFFAVSLVLFISWAGWYIWWSQQGERGGKLAAHFGILAHAYQVRETENGGNLTLSYWVPLPFPSDEAYRFYEKVLGKKGWFPAQAKGLGEPNTWTSSLATTPDTHKVMITYKYFSLWVNAAMDRMILRVRAMERRRRRKVWR